MTARQLVDFADIIEAVREELGIQSGDTVKMNRIRRDINLVYLQEVVPAARWKWLEGYTTVQLPARYNGGTVSLTAQNTTVTISDAPSSSLGSFAGYRFQVGTESEIYDIVTHTAGATTFTITPAYNSSTASLKTFKIWKDQLVLPTDCRETIQVWHDFNRKPLEGRGMQEFEAIRRRGESAEGRPEWYYTGDYEDPSSGDGEEESDRQRVIKLFPACHPSRTNVKVTYVREVSSLDLDGDEPVLPLEDRIVLVYGALARMWLKERNPEASAQNQAMFDRKLARMLGKVEDTIDKPTLAPDSIYMASKRGPRMGRFSASALFGAGGGGGATEIKFLQDVTISGGILTANLTVNADVTIDGRDISDDGAALDAHIAAEAGVHGVSGDVVGTTDTQTLSNKTYELGASFQNKVLVASDSVDGNIEAHPSVDADELSYLADAEAWQSIALPDNTANTVIDSFTIASFNVVHFQYAITRGSGNIEAGFAALVSDGTSASLAAGASASLGTLGVTLDADVSTGSMRILATTTSTGAAAAFKWRIIKALA